MTTTASAPVYCFISGGNMHCVPVTSFNDESIASITMSSSSSSSSKRISHHDHSSSLSTDSSDSDADRSANRPGVAKPLKKSGKVQASQQSHQYQPTASVSDNDSTENESKYRTIHPTIKMSIKHKNLLYTLNNPSLSDIDTDDKSRSVPSQSGIVASQSDISPPLTSSHDGAQLSSILEHYSTHSIYLPHYSVNLPENFDNDYRQIKHFLTKVFPTTWVNKSNISISQLTGGITNMLLSCNYTDPTSKFSHTVLMRVYGQGTNLIIDRHREFVSHLVLNSLQLAPPIHARFANGLVYGFLPGRSLSPHELKHPKLFPLIANQLGNWHNNVNSDYIGEGVEKLRLYTTKLKRQQHQQQQQQNSPLLSPDLTGSTNGGSESNKKQKRQAQPKKALIANIWDLIEDWINVVPAVSGLIDSFKENDHASSVSRVDANNIRSVIGAEFDWLKSTLNQAVKSPTVSCHCDLLSGNIIVPDTDEFSKDSLASNNAPTSSSASIKPNPIQFIDYEYMLPAPRAFDIANHLAEYQGFDCDRSAIPNASFDNVFLIDWCRGYLNHSDSAKDKSHKDEQVHQLLNEIICYYGMPGFYWGIWASIQSEISNIDFNYSHYSKARLQEYWDWKKSFITRQS